MGSFTDYLENGILDHVFGATEFTPPSTLYIGLSTTTITDAGGNITEPSADNGYSRAEVMNNTTNWPAASIGAKSNGTRIMFQEALDSWGTITDFFVADDLNGGNILAYAALNEPIAVSSGKTVNFAIGALYVTLAQQGHAG